MNDHEEKSALTKRDSVQMEVEIFHWETKDRHREEKREREGNEEKGEWERDIERRK